MPSPTDLSPIAAISRAAEISEAPSAAACSDLRWVGSFPPAAECPRPLGRNWSARRLIDDEGAPPQLRRFCVYEWTGDGDPAQGGLPEGRGPGGRSLPPTSWLDRDCFVNAGQSPASDVADIVRPILAAAHRRQIESPAPLAGATPVEVAIIDTWASETNSGRSAHGFAMAGIVEEIACSALTPASPCPIQARPYLALDRFGPHGARDETHGGTYGPQSKLAEAVYEAVTAPGPARRVLHLAVGWGGQHNGSTSSPGQLSQPVQAVLASLEYAACQRALVIASAGNATGGPEPGHGPIFPAAFERIPAPACTGVVRPLVYSAAGVDGLDEPLPNARPGARPVLAAPSFAVPSSNTIAGVPIAKGPYTGSSVSVSVLSAIAALVWQADDTLAPHEVMETIRSSAEVLSDPADYCWSPPCGPVRRASVCRAMAKAGAPVDCTDVRIAAGAGSNPTYSPQTIAAIESVSHGEANGLALLFPHEPAGGGCSVPVLSLEKPDPNLGASELCPSEVLTNDLSVPALDPQPGTDPCPACTLVLRSVASRSVLEIAINDALPPDMLVRPQTLSLNLGGSAVERYDLGSAVDPDTGAVLRDGLQVGKTYRVELPSTQLVFGSGFDATSIEWTSESTSEEVFKSSFPVVVE